MNTSQLPVTTAPAGEEHRIAPGDSGHALAPEDPAILLGYAYLCNKFETIRAHRPGPGAQADERAIHQMRVAARRSRMALRLFAAMLPPDLAPHLNTELRWFARSLGDVRDLDVHTERLRHYLQDTAGGSQALDARALSGFELSLRRARRQAKEAVAATFSSDRCRALMEEFEALAAGPDAASLRRWHSFRISEAASSYLSEGLTRLRRRARKVHADSPDEHIHQLRIATKRFRYELELFAEVYAPLTELAVEVQELQDLLGEFQDAKVAAARVQNYLLTIPSQRRAASAGADQLEQSHREVSPLLGLLEREGAAAESVRSELPGHWQRFRKSVTRKRIAGALISA